MKSHNKFSYRAFLPKSFAKTSLVLACCAAISPVAQAGIELYNSTDADNTTSVLLGGYAKIDVRHVNGDLGYQDYWLGNNPGAVDTSKTGFNVKESRVNLKITQGDVFGFVEMDFFGGNGNEVVSNSVNPRLRHFYVGYQNWTVGQTWSTFMPLAALPESLDFGGPMVAEVFIRQAQIRYTYGNWQFAIEQPETWGDGDIGGSDNGFGTRASQVDEDESIPDFVARYNMKADWGQISVAALLRQVDQGGIDETAVAANVSGLIKTVGKDDFRFQVTVGEPGRYVGAALSLDIVTDANDEVVVEETTAFVVAYRHFWTETLRSTAYYGKSTTDVQDLNRSHYSVNLIADITDKLDAGVELGQFKIDDVVDLDSTYLQLSAKYSF